MATPETIIQRLRDVWQRSITILATDGGANDGKGVEVTGRSDGSVNVYVTGGAADAYVFTFAAGASLAAARARDRYTVDLAQATAKTITFGETMRIFQVTGRILATVAPTSLPGSPDALLDVLATGGDTYEPQHDVNGSAWDSQVGSTAATLALFPPAIRCGGVTVTLAPTLTPSTLTDGWVEVIVYAAPER